MRFLVPSVGIQRFKICCFRSESSESTTLVIRRNHWWKRLMAMDHQFDGRLSLWPHILKKADTWKRETSHSHLDVLYHLLKEKHTVVLQNVRRRRIRKRKRYGFDDA